MSVALLFPGQGAQQPGMLGRLPDGPAAAAALEEAKTALGEMGFTAALDSARSLTDTVATQLCLLVSGVVCARSLELDHGMTAEFVAGHSVGAFAAAVAAGVLSLTEALVAVQIRAESMRAACQGGAWGMAAVTGLPTRATEHVVEAAATEHDPLWVANINSATETVVGGTETALVNAAQVAAAAGATAVRRLDVAVASHGPIQAHTAQTMKDQLSAVPRRPTRLRYLTNTGGRVVSTSGAVLDDLAAAVGQPVRWYDGVRLLAELEVTATVEAAPGHTLTRLMASAAPHVAACAIDDIGVAAAAASARRRS